MRIQCPIASPVDRAGNTSSTERKVEREGMSFGGWCGQRSNRSEGLCEIGIGRGVENYGESTSKRENELFTGYATRNNVVDLQHSRIFHFLCDMFGWGWDGLGR